MDGNGRGGAAGASAGTMSTPEWESLRQALDSADEQQLESWLAQMAARGAEALPALWEALNNPAEDVRWAALRILAEMEAPPVEWMVWMLADPSPLVRQAAALALAAHPHPRALPALIEALGDPDALAADLAMQAVIAQGAEAVPALLEVLNDLPAAARLRVARALASVKDTRTIPALMKLMENGSMLSAYWAERGLENLRQDLIYFFPGR